jgi:hypothetical protein
MADAGLGFAFKEGQKVNLRALQSVDIRSVLQGNTRDLLAVMDDLAYVNLAQDGKAIGDCLQLR